MIYVDRSRVSTPKALDGNSSPGAIELEKNARLASRKAYKEMKFSVYKDASVKIALDELFYRKCAYCEASLLGTQPGDVEHYRPKGEVWISDSATGQRKELIPGYYWLAASWENLLPSCVDCNRPRTQSLPTAERRVVGKGNWFPLADERLRAAGDAELASEPRLLLDPCRDLPHDHLVFRRDGSIEPSSDAFGQSEQGRATISVCALDRLELVQARAQHRRYVELAIRQVLAAMAAGDDPDARDLEDLAYFVSPRAPFTAYARQLVRDELGPILAAL